MYVLLRNEKKKILSHALMPGPEVKKTFFMLNSTEHEIYHAQKC